MLIIDAAPDAVQDRTLDDLRTRLRSFRPVALQGGEAWSLGVDPAYFEELIRAWRDDYDWRVAEGRVRAFPWVVAGSEDAPVRLVHQPSTQPDACTAVLLHGWPDSVLRFQKVLPKLTDLNLVVPAYPGYPFSVPTSHPVESADDMAVAIADAISELGYERYVVSAGDVGTDVAESLAARYPDRVAALHLTDLSHRYALTRPPADPSAEEQTYLDAVARWHELEGGYNHQQSTKPNTLAVGLGDSPAGLAAWILEKLYGWSDSSGDLSSVFTREDVLDWVTAYWVTGAIGTSFSPYAHRVPPGTIVAPAVFTMFPHDLVNAPRVFTERFFDVRAYTVAGGGGHFDAWERPSEYAEGVRTATALGRATS